MTRPTWDLVVLGAVVALLGFGTVAWGLRSRRGSSVWVGVFVLATAGLFFHQAVRISRLPPRNPIPATEQSVQLGHQLYRAHCAVCHGSEGRGDGPAAASLVPRPADLRRTARMADPLLFTRITEGLPGTPMPAFRDVLTEEERWHVVNFLRALADRP
ncbi:MAG: cytochrome c [Armatimonadota bacterium]|nr:cytochrome c [Armatimonadota bacterium]MDR7392230.1 cytochrome c [Armatimonadota bacterium]MDR7413759.1 cytochrome c [Armatimonadota bacterium]MDR7430269.1 cytochrome c [Armatimonadota bacterium]MDR7432973.1 cytochrome c [Armatimonadota bacterium]